MRCEEEPTEIPYRYRYRIEKDDGGFRRGRTVLGLADMVRLLSSEAGKYKQRSALRMKRTGIARSRNHREYLVYVESMF